MEYLRFKWENFLDDYKNSVSRRDDEFNRILEMYPQNGIEKLSALDMLFISEDFFRYHQVDIKREDVAEFKITKWNGLQINYKDGVTIEVYHNMLVIEDLKMLM
jgi:hypothetical protein